MEKELIKEMRESILDLEEDIGLFTALYKLTYLFKDLKELRDFALKAKKQLSKINENALEIYLNLNK